MRKARYEFAEAPLWNRIGCRLRLSGRSRRRTNQNTSTNPVEPARRRLLSSPDYFRELSAAIGKDLAAGSDGIAIGALTAERAGERRLLGGAAYGLAST
jgi:hypothetical protein